MKSTKKTPRLSLVLLLFSLLISACSNSNSRTQKILVSIIADGSTRTIEVEPGLSVGQILTQNGIVMNNLDKVAPPSYLIVEKETEIIITRVVEEFVVTQENIPYEHQTVQNESLPEGQTILIQSGKNGIQQVTYRKLLEDGIETSNTIFQITVFEEPVPEIVMVGVHAPFTSVAIQGKIAYVIAGNAWIMEESTGNRRPLVTTGDLDGFVFSISPDGDWLLFTRRWTEDETNINSLWVIDTKKETSRPIDLEVKNIYHFADWVANQDNTITYSTVEPRSSPPGWQANNDLHILTFTSSGTLMRNEMIIDSNSGGTYGWWGTDFSWSPNSKVLAYARPDGIGTIDLEKGEFVPVTNILPYESGSDWAWLPAINWSPDNNLIFTVNHTSPPGTTVTGTSTRFDLAAINFPNGKPITLTADSGMFSSPSASPFFDDDHFYIAWLQAIFPNQSDTSRYKLVLMDRDGSNRRIIFPKEGAIGLEPQIIKWAPEINSDNDFFLGLIYQGNIWLINAIDGEMHQVTGDGLITSIDWK